MKTIQEEDLIFDVTSAVKAEKFDDNSIHGSKSTMKRVDFIIEENNKVIFLEIKDPDKPGATNPEKFMNDLKGGNLIPELAGKYRDSLLFSRLRGGYEKPISYVVLVSMGRLEDALILSKTDALKFAIPLSNPQWQEASANSCVILKLCAYKRAFGDDSVWRASDFKD